MNFDEIKDSWDKEGAEAAVQIPPAMSALRKAKHPIDKLRARMKMEFFMQLIAVVLMPFLWRISADERPLFLCFYVLFVAISCLLYTSPSPRD